MDFLDSLDLDTKNKKSYRVRSWYLYEQYKSLENHQLDAAQRLKDRSYQDRILRQELSERKARRKLFNQFGLCQSESRIIWRKTNADSEQTSISNDEFFESYSDHEEDVTEEMDATNESYSRDSSPNKYNIDDYKSIKEHQEIAHIDDLHIEDDVESIEHQQDNMSDNRCYLDDYKEGEVQDHTSDIRSIIEDYKSIEEEQEDMSIKSLMEDFNITAEQKDNTSYRDTVINVVKNYLTDEHCIDYDYSNENQFITMTIAHDLNKQLESVQQNIKCLEDIAQLQDDDSKSSENLSEYSTDSCKIKKNTLCDKNPKEYGNIVAIWARLVSFAYQLIQLNHGNCYNDYSSQFLTAVLACDVLRLGVNRMCHILQPYVSPINYANEESDTPECCYDNVENKKLVQSRKSRKTFDKLYRRNRHFYKLQRSANKNYSEGCWRSCYRHSYKYLNKTNKSRRNSEPWHSIAMNKYDEMFSSSSSSLYISRENISKVMSKGCSCNKKAVKSMLQLAHYLDCAIKDMDDSVSTCENLL